MLLRYRMPDVKVQYPYQIPISELLNTDGERENSDQSSNLPPLRRHFCRRRRQSCQLRRRQVPGRYPKDTYFLMPELTYFKVPHCSNTGHQRHLLVQVSWCS